jgi:hypothetical protein
MTVTQQSPPPGWYPDPEGHGQRYFDGTQWTEHRSGVQQLPPQPPQQQSGWHGGPPPVVTNGYAQPRPPQKKSNAWKWILGVVGLFIVIAIATSTSSTTEEGSSDSGSSSSSSSSGSGSKNSEKAKANEDPEKPNNASDDYTPHVGANGRITVDGIVYSVNSVEQRKTIGDTTIGTAEQASGTYLVVNLDAHSTKGETATLTDETFKVSYKGGPEYSADTDGTVALTMEGNGSGDPFFLTDLQPDSTEKGAVVFDVPNRALGKKLELRVNELGLGTTHGFIRLSTK